jgi:hypothetical protein
VDVFPASFRRPKSAVAYWRRKIHCGYNTGPFEISMVIFDALIDALSLLAALLEAQLETFGPYVPKHLGAQ